MNIQTNNKQMRYERKFLITELDEVEVISIIKTHPALFFVIFPQRTVNNIYFDSLDLDNFHDNQAGISERVKARIRWYGDLNTNVVCPILEFKIKKNALGQKLSFPLKDFSLSQNFTGEYLLQKIILDSNLPQWGIEYLKNQKITLINSYQRKYFSSIDRKYRITLDSEVKFYSIFHLPLALNKFVKEEKLILELKYDKIHDSNAHHITNGLPFRLTKNSKYVSGLNEVWPNI